jgi:autotransporter-associated beta strand protein
MGIIGAMKSPILSYAIVLTFLFVAPSAVYAGSATWSSNPTSGDWFTAANWTPNTIPNGPGDIATFDASTITDISPAPGTGSIEVDSIVFNPGASAYTITVPWYLGEFNYYLYISGTGIVNNSGVLQTFVSMDGDAPVFQNNATAGDLTVFLNPAVTQLGRSGGRTLFGDTSSAGSAMFINNGDGGVAAGHTEFYANSSAANATIINQGSRPEDSEGGETFFFENANAGTATIINEGGTVAGSYGGFTRFDQNSSTADATVINKGTSVEGARGGSSDFLLGASPGNATFIANGTLPGVAAGRIFFTDSSAGTEPRIELFGTGTLEISTRYASDMAVGSIEGDGFVSLGTKQLIAGSNSLSTVFSGVIQDGGEGGSLTKIGAGMLELSGANTYTGGTTVNAGGLVINNTTGSGTGTGAVQVNTGILAGNGTISGPVTVGTGSGTGAFLTPGMGASKATTLTILSAVTFKADGSYTCRLNTKKTKADQLIANGVTIESGAQFAFKVTGDEQLRTGKSATIISNTAATPTSGTFANLPDGSTFTIGPNTFQVSYSGGDGNDLTLTVIP